MLDCPITGTCVHANNTAAMVAGISALVFMLGPSASRVRLSLLRLIEMPQIRRLLARAGGAELAVDLHVVSFPLDEDIVVGLRADVLDELSVAHAAVASRDSPGTSQCVVDRRDLVAQDVRIVL